MGTWTPNSKFYKPIVGESNTNISVWDATLDSVDADIAAACSILSSPNSILWDILYGMGRVVIGDTSYFSTEKMNGGTL